MPIEPAPGQVVVAHAPPGEDNPRPYPTYVLVTGPVPKGSHHGADTVMCRMFDDIPDDPGVLFEEMPLEVVLSKDEWESFEGDPAPIIGRAFRAALTNGWVGGDSYQGGSRGK